jgi:putative transposase
MKVKDYLHKSSRIVINHLVSNNINTLVIGHNKEWKQEINIGSRNNQNFVNIPHSTLINMLKYKCQENGIDVICNEESYTSKCSFIDNESIKKHDTYCGKRITRGLFKSASGKVINTDLNGALNILKKAVDGLFDYSDKKSIEAIIVSPIRLRIN